METIDVALVGSGYIAHYHARALLAQPGVRIRALCTLDGKAGQEFAEQYGIDEITDTLDDVLNRSELHAAVISTPNKFHAPYAMACMEQGQDVFVEKPMAVTAEQGLRMQRCADAHQRILTVGHMWRFDTEVNAIRDLVQGGELGAIVKTKGYGVHVNWGPGGWFVQKDLAGGGALADMGVHAIDTVRYLLGDPMPCEVYAKIRTAYGDYDVDDSDLVVITWDTGTVSVIESGWWHPHADGPEAGTQLFGVNGYASLFPTLYRIKDGETLRETIPDLPPRKEHCDQVMYTRQMQHFIACIRTRCQPLSGACQGQVILRIVDAAYASARSGQVITLAADAEG